jgi:hypothetical protein
MTVSTSSMTQKCTHLVRVFLLFQFVQAFSTHISVQFPRLGDAHRMSEQSSSMQACIAALERYQKMQISDDGQASCCSAVNYNLTC